MRTAHLEIAEVAPGQAIAHLRLGAPDPALALAGTDGCALVPAGDAMFARTWRIDCPGTLTGHHFALIGLGPITSDAVVTIERADGDLSSQLVLADAPAIALSSAAPSAIEIARQFIGLGLMHIATGYDHLLFLLLLVLLLRRVRAVLLAETAFTLSHSISFSATALGWIHVSSAAAETCIAVSLLLLAADIELLRPPPARWRGAGMALVFGLVHGLGFAGGLREIGLPDHAIGSALAGFAGGIELGQVAFLTVALAAMRALRGAAARPRIERAVLYAISGFSGYLVIVRAAALVAASR